MFLPEAPSPGVPEDFPRRPVPGVRVLPLQEGERAAGEGVLDVPGPGRRAAQPRAITQGPRVTVMRGHCHPPGLAGLEGAAAAGAAPRPGPAGGPGTDRAEDKTLCQAEGAPGHPRGRPGLESFVPGLPAFRVSYLPPGSFSWIETHRGTVHPFFFFGRGGAVGPVGSSTSPSGT